MALIEFRIRMVVPDVFDREHTRFYYEENGCVGNLISQLHRELEAGACNECHRATVHLAPEGAGEEWLGAIENEKPKKGV